MNIILTWDDFATLLIISIFLIILNRRIVHNSRFIENFRDRYRIFDKKSKFHSHKNYITRKPVDKQKLIFKDTVILFVALLIIIILVTRSIFFAAVVSDSMSPTFIKNDIILMQNIDREYKVGDIIIFERPDVDLPYSHRILAFDEFGIRTAGDATRTIDWWALKKEDIFGKAVTIQGELIIIKGYGKYFVAENKNQRFGPFSYQDYNLFLSVIKAYGYAIALFALLMYIFLSFKESKKN